jgi:hypothetical protein
MKVSDLDIETKSVILHAKFFTDRPSNKRMRTLKHKLDLWYRAHQKELDYNLYKMIMEVMEKGDTE